MSLLDGELAFTLRDYVSGIEYKRTYTEDDGSKQISRKVELSDIYLNFAGEKKNEGERKLAEMTDATQQCKMVKQSKYQKEEEGKEGNKDDGFGRVTEQDGKAKYKVDLGGKITVYNRV